MMSKAPINLLLFFTLSIFLMGASFYLPYPSEISFIRYVTYGFEALFWIFFAITNSIFLIILKQTTSVHRNLRIILANMCFAYFIVAITRFFILYDHIRLEQGLNPIFLNIITMFAFLGLTAKTASEFTLLIERLVSTIFANKYEKIKSIYISFIFGLLCYIYPCITLPLLFNNIVNKTVFIPVPIIFNICSWIFTIILLKTNKKTYVTDFIYKEKISLNKFTLTMRYQTIENIRTLRAILWFLIYSTFSNAITVSFHTFNVTYFTNESDKEMFAMSTALWYLINAILASLLPFPFIFKHDDIRKHFMILIGRSGNPTSYRTVTGSAINMNNDADTHFNNLKALWMEPPRESSRLNRQQNQRASSLLLKSSSSVRPLTSTK